MAKVLGKEGAKVKACAMTYKAVLQLLILYGIEIWVFADGMMMLLEGFHHMISIWIEVMTVPGVDGGEWEWALMEVALEATGIWLMREYARRRQATIVEYIMGWPIYNLCIGVERTEKYRRLI